MKWSSFATPVRLATPIRTGARVEPNLQRHHYAFEVERVMPGWDEVAPCRDPGEARNTNPDRGTGGAVPPSPIAFEVQERVMPGCVEVAQCRDPGEARNANPDGGNGCAEPPSPLAFEFKNELCQGGMKWPRVAIPVRLATPIRTGAPVQPYLKRNPYAFEVQERVMPGWDEVAPCRDPGEARNTNPIGGTGGAKPAASPLRLRS